MIEILRGRLVIVLSSLSPAKSLDIAGLFFYPSVGGGMKNFDLDELDRSIDEPDRDAFLGWASAFTFKLINKFIDGETRNDLAQEIVLRLVKSCDRIMKSIESVPSGGNRRKSYLARIILNYYSDAIRALARDDEDIVFVDCFMALRSCRVYEPIDIVVAKELHAETCAQLIKSVDSFRFSNLRSRSFYRRLIESWMEFGCEPWGDLLKKGRVPHLIRSAALYHLRKNTQRAYIMNEGMRVDDIDTDD